MLRPAKLRERKTRLRNYVCNSGVFAQLILLLVSWYFCVRWWVKWAVSKSVIFSNGLLTSAASLCRTIQEKEKLLHRTYLGEGSTVQQN